MATPEAAGDTPHVDVGRRYRFGWDGEAYGIWDRRRLGAPIEQFPDEERIQAWLRYRDLEERQAQRVHRRRSGMRGTLLTAAAALIVAIASLEFPGVPLNFGSVPALVEELLTGEEPLETRVLAASGGPANPAEALLDFVLGGADVIQDAVDGDSPGGPGDDERDDGTVPGTDPGTSPSPSPTEDPSPDPSPTPTEDPSPAEPPPTPV